MNKRQKEVLQASLQDEKAVMAGIESNYTSALARIRRNIRELQSNPLTQSKAYQLEFQQQLEAQISGILDTLQGNNFTTIAEYLQTCYSTGFIGANYDWQGQGVPLTIPIDQRQVIKAVQKTGDDFKLSNKLGVNTKLLKEQVKTELQRGLASDLSYSDIARNITDYGQADMNRSKLIARTEGHRVQNDARIDAMKEAKKRGADIVKQWDSTLDGNTRPHHRELDGQIRELDESFEVAGMKVDAPGGFGIAAEDCNCRCCVLQRARWALKQNVDPKTGEVTYSDNGSYTKWNNETGGFIDTTGYEDFKNKYLNLTKPLSKSKQSATMKSPSTGSKPTSKTFSPVETATSKALQNHGIDYNEVALHPDVLTEDEIIHLVAGGDMTSGSCASAALAYAGQKQGWNVLDFRGGDSMDYFSSKSNKVKMFKDLGANSIVSDSAKSNLTNGKRILSQLQEGEEYYLSVGRHAAIVRNKNGVLQYLELQSSRPDANGWKDFGDVASTLKYRFGCSSSSRYHSTAYATDISQLKGDDFRTILGYINTDGSKQRKGAAGHVR